jgi:hypothetical protein
MTNVVLKQLPELVGPMREIIADGVAEKGFHPAAISYAMMLAGMFAMVEARGKVETFNALYAMIDGLLEEDIGGETLQ